MVARLRIRTRMSGPFFDGRAIRAVGAFTQELEEEAAEWALADIRRTYHRSFQMPTGYYESHVRISNQMGDSVVNDGGKIAYGPWLEGVGSRNAPTTRFRGYHAFRDAAARLEARVEAMGYRLLATNWIRRMN
jgi:hypothetical protein